MNWSQFVPFVSSFFQPRICCRSLYLFFFHSTLERCWVGGSYTFIVDQCPRLLSYSKPLERTFERSLETKLTQTKTKVDPNSYGTIWNKLIKPQRCSFRALFLTTDHVNIKGVEQSQPPADLCSQQWRESRLCQRYGQIDAIKQICGICPRDGSYQWVGGT